MPVRKFRDSEDARRELWVDSSDPSLGPRIRALWARSVRLAPSMAPRGLRKFRSVHEADQERQEWIQRRVDFLRAARDRVHSSETVKD